MTNNHELNSGSEQEPTSEELFSQAMDLMDAMQMPEELRRGVARSMMRTLEEILPLVTAQGPDGPYCRYAPTRVARMIELLEVHDKSMDINPYIER